MPKKYRDTFPCGVRMTSPLGWTNCWYLASHLYLNPTASVSPDGRLVAGQEVPALLGVGAAVAGHVRGLLVPGQLRRVAGVDADRHDLEVVAGAERAEPVHAAVQVVQHQRAQLRARVVDQREDDRLLVPSKYWPKLDRLAVSSRKVRSSGTWAASFWSMPTSRRYAGLSASASAPVSTAEAPSGAAGHGRDVAITARRSPPGFGREVVSCGVASELSVDASGRR